MKATGFLLISQKIAHAYNMLCIPVLEKYDIPKVSFDILMFLANNPECCTAQEISDRRNIKKNLVSVHVDKLVGAGYLERNTVTGDRRKVGLAYTDKAKPVIEAGWQMQRRFYQELTNGISKEDLKMNQRILLAIEANAERMSAQ